MELKNYQQEVLRDLADYLNALRTEGKPSDAFAAHWRRRGVELRADGTLRPYCGAADGAAHVTVKVPTAGGKTFIACNAIDTIFRALPTGVPQVVAWFVPSDTILQQTLRNLSNPRHPYREKLDTLFAHRVKVYGKQQLLMGEDFNPIVARGNLCIFVLSIQSFATNVAERRKVYGMNGQLADFAMDYKPGEPRIEGADPTSLIQVIAHLRPVVIIDESHNFEGALRTDAIGDLRPRFVLCLTATPRERSNIVSFVSPAKLKREHMVKLPVIVYNARDHREVVNKAIALQANLEAKARQEEAGGGDYIRPIVLFQAQPRKADDTITFDKLKETLVKAGIPEEQVKIKTAQRNELAGTDLMSRDCPVRFIITVNALKEGWDCPFAYILASIANRSSHIDVEQILGRILRQPYTRRHKCDFLNMSYVFSSSADFNATLDNIVESLRLSGYSRHDYRVSGEAEQPMPQPQANEPSLPFQSVAAAEAEPLELSADDIQLPSATTAATPAATTADGIGGEGNEAIGDLSLLLTQAEEQGKQYEAQTAEAPHADLPEEVMKQVNQYPVRECNKDIVQTVLLPQFVETVESGGIFQQADEVVVVRPDALLEDFDLRKADRNIDFIFNETGDTKRIDLDESDDNNATAFTVQKRDALLLQNYFNVIKNRESLITHLALQIGKDMASDNTLNAGHLHTYVKGVLETMDMPALQSLAKNIYRTVDAFKNKVKRLKTAHRKNVFERKLQFGGITVKPTYAYPAEVVMTKGKAPGIEKKMYQEEEGGLNDFERKVIGDVVSLDCVRCWHRNPVCEGVGFCINGYVNAYPDFIVTLRNGITVALETKGDHLDGSDSEAKLKLGNEWAARAGNKFRYYMVFQSKKIDGAVTLAELLDGLRMLGR